MDAMCVAMKQEYRDPAGLGRGHSIFQGADLI